MADQQNQSLDDILDQEWQALIDSVDATEIPTEFIRLLIVNTVDGNKVVFPVRQWLDKDIPLDKIEKKIRDWYRKNDNIIDSSQYILDVALVREIIEEETDRLLNKHD